MTLVKYNNPYSRLMNNFFDNELDLFSNKHYSNTNTTLPSVNIKENPEAFEVEVAAPGFDKKDFNIELDKGLLTISSEKQMQNEEKEGEKFSKREFSYQSFTRSFTLPELVEDEKITANYKNGVLKIVIPKKEEAKPKPAKQISIK